MQTRAQTACTSKREVKRSCVQQDHVLWGSDRRDMPQVSVPPICTSACSPGLRERDQSPLLCSH